MTWNTFCYSELWNKDKICFQEPRPQAGGPRITTSLNHVLELAANT